MTTASWKEERGKRVFIDYNQNARDRTVASASVVARPDAAVSAPSRGRSCRTWRRGLHDVDRARALRRIGDIQAGMDDAVCDLRVLLEAEREEKDGVGEAPYPRTSPRRRAPRVQSSRARKRD